MRLTSIASVLILFLTLAAPGRAAIEVSFTEGAPTDRFRIANTGACAVAELDMEIDLGESAGRLIFDTTATGAGVDVYRPLRVVEGDLRLNSNAGVTDGDRALSFRIAALPPGAGAAFTIDVDDTRPGGELGPTRVAGSEIEGGRVRVTVRGKLPVEALFDAAGRAVARTPDCPAS